MLVSDIDTMIVGLLTVLALIFLVLREFNCWYWKINKIVEVLSDISGRLAMIEENTPPIPLMSPHPPSTPPAQPVSISPKEPEIDPRTGRRVYVIE